MRVFTFGEATTNSDSGHRCGPDAYPANANANVRDGACAESKDEIYGQGRYIKQLKTWAQEAARLAAPSADFWSVRSVVESSEQLTVRQNQAESPVRSRDDGVMVSVVNGGTM